MNDPGNLHRHRISPSSFGAILGVDERRGPHKVWELVTGRTEPEPQDLYQLMGKVFEAPGLKIYSAMTDRAVHHCDTTMLHPKYPWVCYTPDGITDDEKRIVEVKFVFWGQRRLWGTEANEVPDKYLAQVWGYLELMDAEVCDVIAFVCGDPRIITVERNRRAGLPMLQLLERWHQRHVVEDEEPPFGPGDDADEWLTRIYPQDKRPDLIQATPELVELLDLYSVLRGIRNANASLLKKLETEFKAAIGEHTGLIWEDGKFTWKKCKDSPYIDWESLAWALLTNFVKDEKQRQDLLADYTKTKAGVRRIRFDGPDGAVQEHEAA